MMAPLVPTGVCNALSNYLHSYNVTPEDLFDLFGKFGPIRYAFHPHLLCPFQSYHYHYFVYWMHFLQLVDLMHHEKMIELVLFLSSLVLLLYNDDIVDTNK